MPRAFTSLSDKMLTNFAGKRGSRLLDCWRRRYLLLHGQTFKKLGNPIFVVFSVVVSA